MSKARPEHLTIVTGASRGLGRALAAQLLDAGHTVLTIERAPDASLRRPGAELTQWAADLAAPGPVAARLGEWLAEQRHARAWRGVTLINNAGAVGTIAPLGAVPPADLARTLRIGLEAPMLLCAAFLAATKAWQAQRKVLNVSSGLGRRPMASQSAYCAAKAGLDHFTRCMALDEAALPNGARACALAPGVIDTDMQRTLRGTPADRFPDQARFAGLKRDGQLTSTDDAARRVLAYLARPDFGAEPVADVRG